MNINNYWSKKSPEIARSIFKDFLSQNKIIMDPFLGSGTSLQGAKELDINVKFVGVELNQMPLVYANFNAQPPKLEKLIRSRDEFISFYKKNKKYYEFYDQNKGTYELEKVILDIFDNKVLVKSFMLKDDNLKRIEIDRKKDSKFFNILNKAYSKRAIEFKKKLKRDLLLDENSRIAIKSQMYISNLYSPVAFFLLQEICDKFKNNDIIKIIISSVLHLTKYTDLRSQSQFPFWFPKKDAMERNILILILKKFDSLIKNYDQSKKQIVKKRDFNSLSKSSEKSFLLINKPIQRIGLEVPDNSIDLIFTDPPYFDQVAYSEYLALWEFFLSYKKDNHFELIQTNRKKGTKDKETYLKNLKKCFEVIVKKMKINSQAIIYFKDSKLSNVNDFLNVLSNCGLSFIKQKHVPKKKYTYKQNTTKETTVSGDSLFYFKKTHKILKPNINKPDFVNIEKIIINFTKKYLLKNKRAKIAEILDNGLIKELFLKGYLGSLKDSNVIYKILSKNYLIDKLSRNLIEK